MRLPAQSGAPDYRARKSAVHLSLVTKEAFNFAGCYRLVIKDVMNAQLHVFTGSIESRFYYTHRTSGEKPSLTDHEDRLG